MATENKVGVCSLCSKEYENGMSFDYRGEFRGLCEHCLQTVTVLACSQSSEELHTIIDDFEAGVKFNQIKDKLNFHFPPN